jgi:2-polyprenyl-3-methyl-5-hydroxy-6-metoxy-1,4-benzoquinol methylase
MTPVPTAETERVRRIQDKEAPRYDRQMGFFERILFGGGRESACSRVRGEVLEIAIGTGHNLPFYAPDVRLTGIELGPEMLAIARDRAERLGREVDLRLGDAQSLELEDESFDTVIITFGLCSIPTTARLWRRRAGSCAPGVGSSCSSTCAARCGRYGWSSAYSTRRPCASRPTTWFATRSTIWRTRGSRSRAWRDSTGGSSSGC